MGKWACIPLSFHLSPSTHTASPIQASSLQQLLLLMHVSCRINQLKAIHSSIDCSSIGCVPQETERRERRRNWSQHKQENVWPVLLSKRWKKSFVDQRFILWPTCPLAGKGLLEAEAANGSRMLSDSCLYQWACALPPHSLKNERLPEFQHIFFCYSQNAGNAWIISDIPEPTPNG